MIILFVLFLIQFSVASSCLAVNKDQQRDLAARGWNHGPIELKKEVQDTFKCCGFNSTSDSDIPCDVSLLFLFHPTAIEMHFSFIRHPVAPRITCTPLEPRPVSYASLVSSN